MGSLALTATRPASSPDGELDIALVRAPDGAWVHPQASDASGFLLLGATSFREHCIARVNSYCFHTRSDYCIRAPRCGYNVSEAGAKHRECRMGDGVEETPGNWDAPGWPLRQKPVLAPDPRVSEKLATQRNVRRMTQHSATHAIGWKANGDVSFLLHSDPGDPGHAEIARVCKYAL